MTSRAKNNEIGDSVTPSLWTVLGHAIIVRKVPVQRFSTASNHDLFAADFTSPTKT